MVLLLENRLFFGLFLGVGGIEKTVSLVIS